ncbi:hypothetical protein TeGR_g12930, partial [Tetraparma gracilis]
KDGAKQVSVISSGSSSGNGDQVRGHEEVVEEKAMKLGEQIVANTSGAFAVSEASAFPPEGENSSGCAGTELAQAKSSKHKLAKTARKAASGRVDVRDGVESKPEALDRGNLVVPSGSRGVVTQMEGGAVDIADGSAKDGVRQIPAGLTCSSSRDGKKVRGHEEATAEEEELLGEQGLVDNRDVAESKLRAAVEAGLDKGALFVVPECGSETEQMEGGGEDAKAGSAEVSAKHTSDPTGSGSSNGEQVREREEAAEEKDAKLGEQRTLAFITIAGGCSGIVSNAKKSPSKAVPTGGAARRTKNKSSAALTGSSTRSPRAVKPRATELQQAAGEEASAVAKEERTEEAASKGARPEQLGPAKQLGPAEQLAVPEVAGPTEQLASGGIAPSGKKAEPKSSPTGQSATKESQTKFKGTLAGAAGKLRQEKRDFFAKKARDSKLERAKEERAKKKLEEQREKEECEKGECEKGECEKEDVFFTNVAYMPSGLGIITGEAHWWEFNIINQYLDSNM